jgi:hypothetical protein
MLEAHLNESTEQSPSWEANTSYATQEVPHIWRNPKVHHRTHKSPPPVHILSQIDPVFAREAYEWGYEWVEFYLQRSPFHFLFFFFIIIRCFYNCMAQLSAQTLALSTPHTDLVYCHTRVSRSYVPRSYLLENVVKAVLQSAILMPIVYCLRHSG